MLMVWHVIFYLFIYFLHQIFTFLTQDTNYYGFKPLSTAGWWFCEAAALPSL